MLRWITVDLFRIGIRDRKNNVEKVGWKYSVEYNCGPLSAIVHNINHLWVVALLNS